MSEDMSRFVMAFGFESLDEFNEMVSKVDVSDTEKLSKFKQWQQEDGTKEGLLELMKGER